MTGNGAPFASTGIPWTAQPILLKADELGRIEIIERDGPRGARVDRAGGYRWCAPALLAWSGRELLRSYIAGAPMQQAQPRHRSCYRDALRLLTRLHRRATGKRLYKLIARRVFGYRDNEGQGRVRD